MTFVINSAICDFIYCTFHFPIYAIAYLNQSSPIKNYLFCQITAYFRNIVVYAGYMFFGMTALARLAKTSKISVSPVNGRLLASFVWIYAIIICSPQIPNVCVGTSTYIKNIDTNHSSIIGIWDGWL